MLHPFQLLDREMLDECIRHLCKRPRIRRSIARMFHRLNLRPSTNAPKRISRLL
jgi:hypothetical protein